MEKTGLEIVNEKAAKIVAFFDIPKPQKKRMFLTGIALGFLILSLGVPEADANNSAGVTYCAADQFCGYVGIDGNVYDWDNNAVVTSGTAKTGLGISAGPYPMSWSQDATAPYTIDGGTLAGLSFDKLSLLNFSSQAFLTGSTAIFCEGYRCIDSRRYFNVKDVSVTFGPPNYTNSMAVVYNDGTSNACPGNDNEKIWTSNGSSVTYICQKTDGSYVSNDPNYTTIPTGIKELIGDYYRYDYANSYVYVKSDNTLGGINHTVPSGTWRDVRLYSQTIGCGVSKADNIFRCWNNGTIFRNGTVPAENTQPPEPSVITYPDGTECYNFAVPKLSTVAWMTPEFMFSTGTVTTQVFTGGSNYGCTGWGQKCGDKIRTLNDDGSGNMDFLTLYNYDSSSIVRTPSWRNPATATGPRSTLIADDFEPQILGIGSLRDNVKFAADVWQFASVQNPGINVPWAYWIAEGKGVNQVFASGGTATLVNANMTTSLTLFLQEFSVPPIGFRMGKSTESEAKTQCRIGNNACKWELRGTQYQCMPKIYNGYAGVCSVDTNGRCSPTITASGTVSEPLPIEGSNVTTDQYGNVISVTPGNSNVQGTTVNIDGVFDCAEYDGFLDIFPCSLQVAKNIWQLVSDSVNQTDSAAKKVTETMGSVGSGSTGSIDLSPVSPNGTNLADKVFRGAWNGAFETNEFNKFGMFALIGALFLMVLSIIFVIALINRK